MPAFEHYTLAEITTGRVEWFLKAEAKASMSRAKQSRTVLNLIFAFALRHDAISRNPVQGTSPLSRKKGALQALSLEQIASIRTAATTWRNRPKTARAQERRPHPRPHLINPASRRTRPAAESFGGSRLTQSWLLHRLGWSSS